MHGRNVAIINQSDRQTDKDRWRQRKAEYSIRCVGGLAYSTLVAVAEIATELGKRMQRNVVRRYRIRSVLLQCQVITLEHP